jgi:hypothetical protein
LIEFVRPRVDDRILIEVVHCSHEAILEFLLGCDADVAQHGAGEFGKEALDEIEPRAVLGSEGEFEPVRGLAGKPSSGLFGDMRGVIVEDQLDRASVKRDGVWKNAPATELVPGDLVKLSLGGVVAADVKLTGGEVLLDQSMLTGESVPIEAGAGLQTFAGALVRRGEAEAEVTATGARTKFGRTAELVRTAHIVSTQQKAVLRVVRNLAAFNGVIIVLLVAYSWYLKTPVADIIPLVLTAMLASIPVALPATFTLASALGARALAKLGVLPTRLSAVDEAASMVVLCADKTGTLTQNALTVTTVRPMPGFDEAHVLALAALASSDGGQDPVDGAIRAAAASKVVSAAFTKALGRPVRAEAVPRAHWEEIFRSEGMGNPLPRMQMVEGFNKGWIDFPDRGAGARTGWIDVDGAIAALVREGTNR